jgi:hypothetical protein
MIRILIIFISVMSLAHHGGYMEIRHIQVRVNKIVSQRENA